MFSITSTYVHNIQKNYFLILKAELARKLYKERKGTKYMNELLQNTQNNGTHKGKYGSFLLQLRSISILIQSKL